MTQMIYRISAILEGEQAYSQQIEWSKFVVLDLYTIYENML